MTLYETMLKPVRVKVKEVCDICGSETSLTTLFHGHNSWGNDSSDSVASIEYCSPKCYRIAAEQFLTHDNASEDTAYFDDIDIENLKALMGVENE